MKKLIFLIIILIIKDSLIADILINEIACGTSGDDWVELYFHNDGKEKIDISNLYVTMYYGTNEHLSDDPVTIYSFDRPETPYDDRFVVIHLTESIKPDETDITGDTNHNGYIEIYCNNYSGSLWNSDGVVAIDNDDDPDNGGMIDFAAYSNHDGSLNETIKSYVIKGQSLNQWSQYSGENIQECMIDIGVSGLSPSMTIARKNSSDTNSMDDYQVTKYQTPGRSNILENGVKSDRRLFKTVKQVVTIVPTHPTLGSGNVDIFVYETCNIRFRIFSSIGMLIHESPLHRDIYPGKFSLTWNIRGLNRTASTGLYIGHIEATSSSLKKSETEYIYLILSHYK